MSSFLHYSLDLFCDLSDYILENVPCGNEKNVCSWVVACQVHNHLLWLFWIIMLSLCHPQVLVELQQHKYLTFRCCLTNPEFLWASFILSDYPSFFLIIFLFFLSKCVFSNSLSLHSVFLYPYGSVCWCTYDDFNFSILNLVIFTHVYSLIYSLYILTSQSPVT